MESVKSDPNLGIMKKTSDHNNDSKKKKENVTPDDQFEDKNIDLLAYQLRHSAKKPLGSKLHSKHSIMFEGIEVGSQRIKRHSMITRLDKLKNTPTIDLRSRSVIKSEYKYEEIALGSNVIKPRNLFASDAFESSCSLTNNTSNIIISKQTKSVNDSNQFQNNQNGNSNIPSSAIKRSPKINVINSHGGVKVAKSNKFGDGGMKVFEKQLRTVSKQCRQQCFISRVQCAVKTQNKKSTEPQWTFKARPANVLKKKPFMPKLDKKYTKPENILLNTERRAQEWMVFEKKISHHEEMSKRRQEENKIKEMDLMKKMRQQTIHKAEPIKKYKSLLIRKSEKCVTVPHSPTFSKRSVGSDLN